jgi:hypothetical protein
VFYASAACLTLIILFERQWLTLTLSTLLAVFIYFVWYLSQKKQLIHREVNSLRLTLSGECQFNQQTSLQLSKRSKIGVLGYWLVFEGNIAQVSSMFIFKDSLSIKDRARLARTIKYLQQHG